MGEVDIFVDWVRSPLKKVGDLAQMWYPYGASLRP